MSEHSSGETRADICEHAGEPDLLGRSTVIEIVRQGGRLIQAQRERARAALAEASQAGTWPARPCRGRRPRAWIGARARRRPAVRDPEDPQPMATGAPAGWVATGFPGCEPSPAPVSPDEPLRGG